MKLYNATDKWTDGQTEHSYYCANMVKVMKICKTRLNTNPIIS